MSILSNHIYSIMQLLNVVCVGIFIYRLKYSKQYGVLIWGTFLFSSLIFEGVVDISHKFFLASFSKKECMMLFVNVLMIFELGIVLWLFAKFKKVAPIYPLFIFMVFMAIWLVEFFVNGASGVVSFRTAQTFSQVLTVVLSAWYLFELYTNPFTGYSNTPFFWIVMGLLFSSTICSILFIPAVAQLDEWSKGIIGLITGISQLLSLIFYSIGFWKTKNWVLQNQIN